MVDRDLSQRGGKQDPAEEVADRVHKELGSRNKCTAQTCATFLPPWGVHKGISCVLECPLVSK